MLLATVEEEDATWLDLSQKLKPLLYKALSAVVYGCFFPVQLVRQRRIVLVPPLFCLLKR
jgi:hypothetical protein